MPNSNWITDLDSNWIIGMTCMDAWGFTIHSNSDVYKSRSFLFSWILTLVKIEDHFNDLIDGVNKNQVIISLWKSNFEIFNCVLHLYFINKYYRNSKIYLPIFIDVWNFAFALQCFLYNLAKMFYDLKTLLIIFL